MSIDLIYFRKQIEAELLRLNESLAQARTEANTVMLDQSSVGRLSRMDAIQQQAMAQEMLDRLQLNKRKLEAALARIDTGIFGFCCECEAEVEPERLQIDPGTVFCNQCTRQRQS